MSEILESSAAAEGISTSSEAISSSSDASNGSGGGAKAKPKGPEDGDQVTNEDLRKIPRR